MIVAPLAEIKAKLSEFVNKSKKETILITKKGRPAAAIIAVGNNKVLKEILLDKKIKLSDIIATSKKNAKAKGAIPEKKFWKELNV